MRPLKYIAISTLAVLCAAISASAATVLTITVNTTSIAGTVGDIDFNFTAGFTAPDATALVSMWTSDGTLSGVPSTSGTTSGVLPANVTMKIIGGTPVDYFHDFTFGNFLMFNLALNFDSPNPATDDTFGLALYDGMTMPLLVNGSQGDFIFTVDLHPDGSYTTHDASANGELTISAAVPEPSTLTLFSIGLLAAAFPLYRRIRAAHHRSETK